MIRAILIAAGEGTRWGNYTGQPKHLANFNGERLIDRTCRQLRERGIIDVFVVANTGDYANENSTLFIPTLHPEYGDADKFLSSTELWDPQCRTIIFYGDVFFTDKALKKILEAERKDWTMFCRFGPSKVTGTPWGECFAISMLPEHHQEALTALEELAAWGIPGRRVGGWEWLKRMNGVPYNQLHLHKRHGRSVEIDDFTDDIDFPDDYDRLIDRLTKKKWRP